MGKKKICIVDVLLTFSLCAILFSSCGSQKTVLRGSEGLALVVSTLHLKDALESLTKGRPEVSVHAVLSPGANPHSYHLRLKDIELMIQSDYFIYHGLNLEPFFHPVTNYLGSQAWAFSDFIDPQKILYQDNLPDPHVWNDLLLWAEAGQGLAQHLGKFDPLYAELYQHNALLWQKELLEAHQWAQGELADIPFERRWIVSSHDAFSYLGNVYDFQVLSVMGLSTDIEPTFSDYQHVLDLILEYQIPVFFTESQFPPRIAELMIELSKSRGFDLTLVDEKLYTDDLGIDHSTKSHLGAFRHNVRILKKYLGRKDVSEP